MIPVILSGGSGSRLWPLSRQFCPKQFLDIHTDNTLFQETILRLKRLDCADSIVVCNKDHRFAVANNLQDVSARSKKIILEPVGRNTAPAIAAAALVAIENNEDPVILVLPADHTIQNEAALSEAYKTAEKFAKQDYLVTFGIQATSPHTGYGYIKRGKELEGKASEVGAFIEKPNQEKAENFLKEGGYLWNSGMFCFKASRFLQELGQHHPQMLKTVKDSVANAKEDYDFFRLAKEDFSQAENISIDYAVMEKTDKACVVSIDAEWNDIGSWDAVWDVCSKDPDGNVCQSKNKGDMILKDTKDSFIHASDKLLVGIGLENLMVIDTPDALLVADKKKAQDVKIIVEQLKKENRVEAKNHSKVDRPWGYFDLLHQSETSEIKHISIKEGAQLTLQKHEHRSEHWVVLKGKARVTKQDDVLTLEENQSVYIPVGAEHSLENIGDGSLEIIEVRTGTYIDEEDIIRI